jgi:hypothetical protein
MSTFAQMRAVIADDLDRSDLTTQINRAINRAITHYEKERFWFNEKTGTFSTVANQSSYGSADSIPTDMAEIDYMEVTVTSTDKPEIKGGKTFSEIAYLIGGGGTGSYPEHYAFYQEKLYFYPIPDSVKTITVYYQQKYTELSADADTNDWTTYAEDLIESRACWWIYSRILKDMEQANMYKGVELDALESLRAKTEKLIKSEIKPTEF